MDKIQWGIIGSGSIAEAFAHSIKYCKNSELKAVFGRNEEKVAAFASKFSTQAYIDLELFFAANDIDAV